MTKDELRNLVDILKILSHIAIELLKQKSSI